MVGAAALGTVLAVVVCLLLGLKLMDAGNSRPFVFSSPRSACSYTGALSGTVLQLQCSIFESAARVRAQLKSINFEQQLMHGSCTKRYILQPASQDTHRATRLN